MSTYITGDIHGAHDIGKLSSHNWPAGSSLTANDRLVICGDFGLVWCDPPSQSDEHWLSWLESKPWGETLFVDGNHENHDLLDAMDVSEWHGGQVHRLPGHPSVIHLMRGETYEVDGDVWWCFGGAQSHDRQWRVEGRSWWAREMPSDEEMAHGLQTLAAIGNAPDYVFTHEMPTPYVRRALPLRQLVASGYNPLGNYLTDYLEKVDQRLDHERLRCWYAGHYHTDSWLDQTGQHRELYYNIYELGADEPSNLLG